MEKISKWQTLEKSEDIDLKIFTANWYKRQHPINKKTGNFIVLNSPRWVNIIPITKDNNVVLIEQYRHGIDNLTIEIPGGLVEQDEDPRIAAERECTEETGYKSNKSAILLSEILPNPAFLNNICYSFVWFDCEKIKEQKLDIHEEIKVFEVPLNKIKEYILNKKIQHSLVMNAFFLLDLKYNKLQ